MTVRAARASKSKPKEKSANAERVDRFRTRRARAASGVPAVRETTAAMELADSIGMNRSIPELWGALPESMWQRVFESQPMDSPGGKLLAIRTDPTMRTWSIERQCAEAGVDAVRLARMVSDVALSSALVSSVRHIHDVVHGVAESAKSVLLTCELCLNLRDGEDEPTYIEVTHPRDASRLLRIECPKCGGMGKTRRDGNPRAVETFLKLHGGLEENNAPAVQVNTQINLGMQHSSGVHRGQMLLEQGRRRAGASVSAPSSSSAAPIVVTATAVEPETR